MLRTLASHRGLSTQRKRRVALALLTKTLPGADSSEIRSRSMFFSAQNSLGTTVTSEIRLPSLQILKNAFAAHSFICQVSACERCWSEGIPAAVKDVFSLPDESCL